MTRPTESLPRSQYLVPDDPSEEQQVSVEVFPDVENYHLQVEARQHLVALGTEALDNNWEFLHLNTPPSLPPPPNPPDSEGIITISHPHETEPPEMCQGDKNEDPDSSRVLLGHAWGGKEACLV